MRLCAELGEVFEAGYPRLVMLELVDLESPKVHVVKKNKHSATPSHTTSTNAPSRLLDGSPAVSSKIKDLFGKVGHR